MKKPITSVDQIKPGMQLRLFFGDNNIHNGTIHIRAIVDDYYFVLRKWSPRKGWMYRLEHYYYFKYMAKNPGAITLTGKQPANSSSQKEN